MPAIDFPNSPVDQETCIRAGKTWIWTAAKTKWSVVSSGGSAPTLASLLTTLGIPTYADITTANTALEIGKPFYNAALTKLDITTA